MKLGYRPDILETITDTSLIDTTIHVSTWPCWGCGGDGKIAAGIGQPTTKRGITTISYPVSDCSFCAGTGTLIDVRKK